MTVLYIEPSALLKRYRPEEGTALLDALFEGKRIDEVFCTSYFTAVELTSVLTRMERGRIISRTAYRQATERLSGDLQSIFQVFPVTDAIVTVAISLASEYALRAPDAIQLSSALTAQQASPQDSFLLVCSDGRLNEAAQARGLPVVETLDESASLERLALLRQP